MSKRDPRVTLAQIKEAAERIRSLCAGKSYPDLLGNWQSTAALERQLEIIGEGVKRLPEEIKARHSGVPWREIAGMRDHLIHGYDNVDHRVLWNTAVQDVPALLTTVERMLAELGTR